MQNQYAAVEAWDHKVTKAKVIAYVERTFARADQDGDGLLTFHELEQFLSLLCHPTESAALRQALCGTADAQTEPAAVGVGGAPANA
jgi:hypothetical protein